MRKAGDVCFSEVFPDRKGELTFDSLDKLLIDVLVN